MDILIKSLFDDNTIHAQSLLKGFVLMSICCLSLSVRLSEGFTEGLIRSTKRKLQYWFWVLLHFLTTLFNHLTA